MAEEFIDESEDDGENTSPEKEPPNKNATPLCLGCLKPVDPNCYYCPNCGEASNHLTQYIPFVNIRWQTGLYAKMCRQVWFKDVSVFGKLMRLFVTVLASPLLLIFMLFLRPKKKSENPVEENDENP